jgi:dienelactone hydrolase
MRYTLSLIAVMGIAFAQQGKLPAKGDSDIAGGIFSISLTELAVEIAKDSGKFFGTGPESPKGAKQGAITTTGGTGPYPAHFITDPSLPKHTIYVPKIPPPANVKMPVVAWGNGACGTDGTGFANFLTQIASHGYIVIADGAPGSAGKAAASSANGGASGLIGALGGGAGGGQSKVSDMRDSIDWALAGKAAKYGNIDTTKVAAAGQSCGGLESYSTSYHDPRVKLTMLFNMGIYQDNKRYLLKELKAPVAYFLGGVKDTGFANVSSSLLFLVSAFQTTLIFESNTWITQAEKDYPLLPEGLPSYKASLDTGHLGTYWAPNGGKSAKAAVAYLQWQFRDDPKSKAICLDSKAEGSLVSDNWKVVYKNWGKK